MIKDLVKPKFISYAILMIRHHRPFPPPPPVTWMSQSQTRKFRKKNTCKTVMDYVKIASNGF